MRMFVFKDADGGAEIAYTDFGLIAWRHHIERGDTQLKMAPQVARGIAAAGAR